MWIFLSPVDPLCPRSGWINYAQCTSMRDFQTTVDKAIGSFICCDSHLDFIARESLKQPANLFRHRAWDLLKFQSNFLGLIRKFFNCVDHPSKDVNACIFGIFDHSDALWSHMERQYFPDRQWWIKPSKCNWWVRQSSSISTFCGCLTPWIITIWKFLSFHW